MPREKKVCKHEKPQIWITKWCSHGEEKIAKFFIFLKAKKSKTL
jgi:hypothetical protein